MATCVRGEQFGERVLERDEGVAASVRAKALNGAGWVALWQGEYGRAQALCEESLQLYRELHDRRGMALALYRLGWAASSRGDAPKATSLFEESIALARVGGDKVRLGFSLAGLALTTFQLADHSTYPRVRSPGKEMPFGQPISGGAAQVLRTTGGPPDLFSLFTMPGEDAENERMRTVVRAQLGEQAFAQALAEGGAMTPPQALAAGQHVVPASHSPASVEAGLSQLPSPSSPHDLTEREVEVLRLVAQGLTDAQVADTLVISPRTVNAHLRTIYSKLNITSRHAATLFAIRQHLI
jgi:DNA-binding CsgD family transcriptional regulator